MSVRSLFILYRNYLKRNVHKNASQPHTTSTVACTSTKHLKGLYTSVLHFATTWSVSLLSILVHYDSLPGRRVRCDVKLRNVRIKNTDIAGLANVLLSCFFTRMRRMDYTTPPLTPCFPVGSHSNTIVSNDGKLLWNTRHECLGFSIPEPEQVGLDQCID